MLVQECANSYGYKLQVVEFWNSIPTLHSFIWSHRNDNQVRSRSFLNGSSGDWRVKNERIDNK